MLGTRAHSNTGGGTNKRKQTVMTDYETEETPEDIGKPDCVD